MHQNKKEGKNNIVILTDETTALIQDSRHLAGIQNRNFTSTFTVKITESIPGARPDKTGLNHSRVQCRGQERRADQIRIGQRCAEQRCSE